MHDETSPGQLDGIPSKRQLIRFDPTVSMGLLMQMAAVVIGMIVAYGKYEADRAQARMEVEQVKATAIENKQAVEKALVEIKGDVKEVSRVVGQMSQNLAVIQAVQQQQQPAQKGK